MTQWVPPPWPLLLWAKERTTAILSACGPSSGRRRRTRCRAGRCARRRRCCGTRPGRPSWGRRFRRGSARRPARARRRRCCGSVGPVRRRGAARRRSGSMRPPRPSAPTLRKSRRLAPSQVVPLRDPLRWNMDRSLQLARASFPRRAEKVGVAGRKRRAPPEGSTQSPRLSGFPRRVNSKPADAIGILGFVAITFASCM